MLVSYTTVAKETESFVKEKNSKFYGFVFQVDSEEDVKIRLSELRDVYPDATHHCYAFILGADASRERANDDGEPSSSAGKPILRQIMSAGVTNTLVVVVRYYGGKKLGVPGLIYAYGEAAKLALEQAGKAVQDILVQYHVTCPFGEENDIYRIAKRFQISMHALHSMTQFESRLTVKLADQEDFEVAFRDLHKIEIQKLD